MDELSSMYVTFVVVVHLDLGADEKLDRSI